MPWVPSDPIRILLPGVPRAWERAGHRIVTAPGRKPFVRSYVPTQTDKEQERIRKLARVAMGNKPPIDGPVELRFVAFMPVPKSWSNRKKLAALGDEIRPTPKPDLSNLVKLCEDAMNKIVFRDDSLITDSFLWKRYADRPRLQIEVRALTWTA
jgi:Holliday junction resolvase RusA-like endonuclease